MAWVPGPPLLSLVVTPGAGSRAGLEPWASGARLSCGGLGARGAGGSTVHSSLPPSLHPHHRRAVSHPHPVSSFPLILPTHVPLFPHPSQMWIAEAPQPSSHHNLLLALILPLTQHPDQTLLYKWSPDRSSNRPHFSNFDILTVHCNLLKI